VITDFETTEQMLRQFIRRASGGRPRATVIVCVPSGLTQVERNAVVEATFGAGAREARLIDEPLAAANRRRPPGRRAGRLARRRRGRAERSEMAVTALGGLVVSSSLQVGGYDFDEAIVRAVQQHHKLLVGQEQAEQVKIEIGSAVVPATMMDAAQIAGRYLVTGMLRRVRIETDEVREALTKPVEQIVAAVRDLPERTPAELSADVARRGITLVGGGALLRGFDEVLRSETGLPVFATSSH
jgi:rod shape-determining protein MreB